MGSPSSTASRSLRRAPRWAASLPELELTDEERTEVTEALREADEAARRGEARVMSVDEIMAAALSD